MFLQNYNHIHVYHTFLYFKHFNIRRVRVLSLCLIFLLFTGWCDLVFFFFNLNLGPVKKCINVVGDTQIPPQMVKGSTAVRWSVFVQSWWNISLNGDRRIKFFLEHYWLPKSMLITMCLDTSITTVPCGHLTSAFVSFMDEYLITLISELSTCIFCVFSVHCTLIKTY